MQGNTASGASTGGITAMLPGRVGDTPIIGAGIYADNSSGAVSCTGQGEYIIRLALSKEICTNMGKMSPKRSASVSLERLSALGGKAGVILTNPSGQWAISHNTRYMAWGCASEKGISVGEKF